MDAVEKVKIALDETRMLILGAQVLLGFQMRSVFQDAFQDLPAHARSLDAVALLLMVAVVGLLITLQSTTARSTTEMPRRVSCTRSAWR